MLDFINMKHRHLCIVILCLLAVFQTKVLAETGVADWMRFNGVLSSIAANDYEAFCTHGTEKLQNNVSKDRFQALVSSLRAVLLGGCNATVTGYTEISE